MKKALRILRQGGVIVHATETCYGFACDAFSEESLKKVYALKKMDTNKPISLLVSSLKVAQKFGIFNKRAIGLSKKYWPGPLTIVVKRKKSLPAFINPGTKTVGFRVPAHKVSLELARGLARPMTTTSANISKKPSTYSISALHKQLKESKIQPDYILDSGRIPKILPSTVIDASSLNIQILRQGSLVI